MNLIILCLFLITMIIIGVWGMKKTVTLNDFFLGGRKIGPWLSAFAYGATYFSSVLFIGFAGKFGWMLGLKSLYIALANTIIGCFLAWLVLGRRTRIMSKNLDAMTMPELMQERFEGGSLKMISAILIFMFLLPYSASVFKGLGYLFGEYFHIPYENMLLLIVAVTGIYIVLGGYFAVTLTSFLQGLIMIIGSIFMVSFVTGKTQGGLTNIIADVQTLYHNHVPLETRPSFPALIALLFMTSFGVWGLPQMTQKFFSLNNEKQVFKTAVICALFGLIITGSAYFTGSLAHLFFDSAPSCCELHKFERIMPELLIKCMPDNLMSIILLLVLSASMSTLSSVIIVSASTAAIDIYTGHIAQNISQKDSISMMRFFSALFIMLSYFIAKSPLTIIIPLMSISWGACAGIFCAPYVYGLFWKRTTLAGVKAGMTTGLVLAVTLFFACGKKNSTICASIAIIVPFIVVPLVSLVTKPPSPQTIKKSFRNIR